MGDSDVYTVHHMVWVGLLILNVTAVSSNGLRINTVINTGMNDEECGRTELTGI